MNSKTFKALFIVALLLLLVSPLFAGGKKESLDTSTVVSEPTYIEAEELLEMMERKDDFLLLDLRRSDDYNTSHIDIAVNADMDSAVQNGDYETSGAILKEVLKKETGNERGEGKSLVLICYTGNRYARAALTILTDLKRNLSDVYVVTGGNKAWNEMNEENEVKEEEVVETTTLASSDKYAWKDIFIFARRIGKSDLDLYSALDIMGICTPCAFESSAGDVGLAGSYADREITTLKGESSVKEMEEGIYLLSFPGNKTAWAEKRWPEKTELTSLLPTPLMKVEYGAYDESYLVVLFRSVTEEQAKDYVSQLKTLFPEPLPGPWTDTEYRGKDIENRIVSFSLDNKALALEI